MQPNRRALHRSRRALVALAWVGAALLAQASATRVGAAGASATPASATPAATTMPVTAASQSAYLVQPEADEAATTVRQGYFWLALAPAQARTVHVVVKNTGAAPLRVRAYAVDSVQQAAGGIDFTTGRTPLRRVGTWLRLSPATLTLAPGQTRRVSATIRLPRDAGPGQHVGGVAIENTQVQTQRPGAHVLIDVHYRRVIAAVLVAPGPQRLAAHVDGVALAAAPAGSVATLALRNSGTVLLKGAGLLQARRRGGPLVAAPFRLETALPGAEIHLPVALAALRLRPGAYTVRLRLRADTGASVLAWSGTVTVSAAAAATPVPTSAIAAPGARQAQTQALPGSPIVWLTGAALVLLLGIGVGVLVGRRAGVRRG